jgi:tetratricopeptide (TPR) repeat protein
MTSGTARDIHLQGHLEEAEALYRETLRLAPEDAESLQGLGVLAYQSGRAGEAAELFARALAVDPGSAALHANRGEALRVVGRLDEAIEHLQTSLNLDSSLPDAWNSLGLIAYEQERFVEAEAAWRESLRIRPQFATAYVNLGSVLKALGRIDDATRALRAALEINSDELAALTSLGTVLCESGDPDLVDEAETHIRRAAELAPYCSQVHNNLGNVRLRQGAIDDALACYVRAIELDPGGAIPRLNIARALQGRGQYEQAVEFYEAAYALDPDPALYHDNLGGVAASRGRFHEAVQHFRQAVEHDPCCTSAYFGLGRAFWELGRLDEAESCLREVLRLDPGMTDALTSLARIQGERGDFDQSCATARAALAIRPRLPDAYCQLSINLKGRMPDDEVEAMRALLGRPHLREETRANLSFGLAVVFDARGLDEQAAGLYEAGNAFAVAARAARGAAYDPDQHTDYIDRLIATFSEEFLAARRGWGDPDPRPVFVVGFPRTGTTLTEQILAAHPDVRAAGELPDAYEVFHHLPEVVDRPGADPFEALATLSPETARAAARPYLDRLNELAARAAARVVDKMPDNIDLLGLIAILWPAARVIRCRRDTRDVAVSCWQTNFARLDWANDPEHIARRLADYERLMAHWCRVRPLEWLDVDYECVVADLDGQARRLIDFLGLGWDPACLRFHEVRRVVRTSSMLDVRQPIRSHSVGRWRRFESILSPLFRALERHGVVASHESRLATLSALPGPDRGVLSPARGEIPV